MTEYNSPFQMADEITYLVAEISEQVGRINVLSDGKISPHLRRDNRIRMMHS